VLHCTERQHQRGDSRAEEHEKGQCHEEGVGLPHVLGFGEVSSEKSYQITRLSFRTAYSPPVVGPRPVIRQDIKGKAKALQADRPQKPRKCRVWQLTALCRPLSFRANSKGRSGIGPEAAREVCASPLAPDPRLSHENS